MANSTAFKPLSKNDVAEILGVTIRTIENHVAAGILPAPAAIGNRRYWHPVVFYRWLEKILLAEGLDTPVSEDEIPNAAATPQSGLPVSRPTGFVAKAGRPAQSRAKGSMVDRARARDSAALRKLQGQ